MKKIYLILTSSLFCLGLFAQAPLSTSKFKEAPNHRADRQTRQLNTSSTSRSIIVDQTVNFIDMTAGYYSSTPDYDLYYVFPDSTPVAMFGATAGNPFCSSMAMTFDLSSDVVNAMVGGPTDGFDPTLTATLDSIGVYSLYTQGRAGYTDTVIYRVVTGGTSANLSSVFYFTGQSTNYPSSNDTTRFAQLLRYPTGSTSGDIPGMIAEYKVPLRVGDTLANGLNYPIAATGGIQVPRVFAITIDYKPGGPYTPYVDTLGERIGSFSVFTAEHNGDGTYSNYVPGDYNGSSWVNNSSKYDASSSWFGWYIPYLAYGATIFESIDLDVVLSQDNPISIDENVSSAKLFQNYPNPTNGFTNVKYELVNGANVSFEVIDVTGKKVISSTEGNRNAGVHTIEVNTNDLNAGIYFYSIIVDGNVITKKMTITK